ncbi:Imm26 family immunity protein [Sphingobium sp.]|uniref:Imm26 family immunity protein n=1 Tax=Sphingobium sp. TaxID=1912891 RepID=UPI0035C75D76
MPQRVKLGDVFLIPIDQGRNGLGQIVGDWKGELYIVVFDKVVNDDIAVATVDGAAIQLAVLTLDAKLHRGDWRIIGNYQNNLGTIPQPWFKVSQGTEMYIEARDRSYTRKATSSEDAMLRLRTVVAPVRLETALKAMHGIGNWHSRFDNLKADYAVETAKAIVP